MRVTELREGPAAAWLSFKDQGYAETLGFSLIDLRKNNIF